jgi:hypothetical protein
MTSLPVRIANFELGESEADGFYKGKFLVALGQEYLEIYAGDVSKQEELVRLHRLDESQVLGGAHYSLYNGFLSVLFSSVDYGGVPKEVGAKVLDEIKRRLESDGIKIESTDLSGLSDLSPTHRNSSRWKGLCANLT